MNSIAFETLASFCKPCNCGVRCMHTKHDVLTKPKQIKLIDASEKTKSPAAARGCCRKTHVPEKMKGSDKMISILSYTVIVIVFTISVFTIIRERLSFALDVLPLFRFSLVYASVKPYDQLCNTSMQVG